MSSILITGATGNIGRELIQCLQSEGEVELVAGVRRPETAGGKLPGRGLSFRRFDFEDPASFPGAFAGVDLLFLLRPPQISDVSGVFGPLLKAAREADIRKVVFLSVQGVEKSSVIPHHKIERLIREMGFEWIFVRPAYFMQNLTTTLLPDIRERGEIVLPAGRAKFNWVDGRDIGKATARLIREFDRYRDQAFELTGPENLDFREVARRMTEMLGQEIRYRNVNPIHFFFLKRNQGIPPAFIVVMILLHFLPRFQAEPPITATFEELTGQSPTPLDVFLEREKDQFHPDN